jgi:DNA-binding NtrC family response regulator
VSDRRGAFETARGGTLFLDEIGDLPLTLQPKLLRALENNEIRPVGSDRVIETDVRIVAATHKNMAAAIRSSKFREDLFYRLNVCHLKPPALKDRIEDFEDLLYQFAKQYRVRLSHAAIQKLKEHSWQGNIRELKNVIARASAYYPSHYIQPDDLPAIMEPGSIGPEVHFVSEPEAGTQGSIIKEIEREMIIRRLAANKGNQRQTARDLGLPKSTLHDRIKAYAIDLDQISKVSEQSI